MKKLSYLFISVLLISLSAYGMRTQLTKHSKKRMRENEEYFRNTYKQPRNTENIKPMITDSQDYPVLEIILDKNKKQ